MIKLPEMDTKLYPQPQVFFTLASQAASVEVLKRLEAQPAARNSLVIVFSKEEEIENFFDGGKPKAHSVALFDEARSSTKNFTMATSLRSDQKSGFPSWAKGTLWGVQVNSTKLFSKGTQQPTRNYVCDPNRCANQLAADFCARFEDQLNDGHFPWGNRRGGEVSPQAIVLPENMPDIQQRLNEGPDLSEAIANQEDALELPTGTKISWVNLAPDAFKVDGPSVGQIMKAFEVFEKVSWKLVDTHPEIAAELLAGVHIPENSALADIYLHPKVSCFSVRRPDLHMTDDGVFASENDEMPGGLPSVVHVDRVYGVNQERWHRAFSWLTSLGPLVFVVSSEWSACYVTETRWLVEYMSSQGYPTTMVTTDELDRFDIREDGVYLDNQPVGTMWRQFPIFETHGKLHDLVCAAHEGLVRMVPEFSHFGNKAWFSIFSSHAAEYQRVMEGGLYGAYEGDDAPVHQAIEGAELFQLLRRVLPDSRLILNESSFPLRIADIEIPNYEALRNLSAAHRNRLVLKVSGANPFSARSYGVLMGHNINDSVWKKWLDGDRQGLPFIIQESLDTKVIAVPVLDIKLDCAKSMSSRILIRPWSIGGELVTASVTAIPSYTKRAHGMLSMCMAAGNLVDQL